jgi:transcriptional regulator with XRE-family HTH domain
MASGTPLNASLIEQRRKELNLTIRAVARAPNASDATIARLERGSGQGKLTLDFVSRLAQKLGLEPVDLFLAKPSTAAPTPDDVKIEAALLAIRRMVSADELARGLGWSITRVKRALKNLKDRLRPTGLRLHNSGGKYGLAYSAQALPTTELRSLEREGVARSGMTVRDARLLHGVLAGKIDPARNPRAKRLSRLRWIGTRGRQTAVSEELAFSLGLPRRMKAQGDARRG